MEDCPKRFDTNQWITVFDSKYSEMSKRTAKTWLREASNTPMVKKIAHGIYEKNLELINENEIALITDSADPVGKLPLEKLNFVGIEKSPSRT